MAYTATMNWISFGTIVVNTLLILVLLWLIRQNHKIRAIYLKLAVDMTAATANLAAAEARLDAVTGEWEEFVAEQRERAATDPAVACLVARLPPGWPPRSKEDGWKAL